MLTRSYLLARQLFFVVFVSMSFQSNAQAPVKMPASLSLDYQVINLKQVNRVDLGIAGIHLLIQPFNNPFYMGGAVYGAVKGIYSGFFALGAEVGLKHKITKNLEFELGSMIGAGGGQGTSAFTGEGQMLQFHSGINYIAQNVKIGVAYSNLRFLNTSIVSNSVLVSINAPFEAEFYPFDFNKLMLDPARHQKYAALVTSAYYPYSNVTDVSGASDTQSTKFIGVELGYEMLKNIYGLINFKGAMYGHKHGYADFFVGLAIKHKLFLDELNMLVKLNAGTGGGAGVDTGSGLLFYPQAGLEVRLTDNVSAELDVGLVKASANNYRSNAINAQLNYYLNSPSKAKPYPVAMRLGNQVYLNPTKTNDLNPDKINLVSVKLDSYLNSKVYASGQMAFAYTGNVAGYFSGLLGLGINQPLKEGMPVRGIAELLVGAAGGAGLDLGNGFIVAPNIGLNYQLNEYASLYALGGKTISTKGAFSSWTVEGGLKYQFSVYL